MKKILLLFIFSFYFSAITYAQHNQLDPSFGRGGFVRASFGDTSFINGGGQVLLQPDGSIYSLFYVDQTLFIAKRLPDGSPDLTYGDQGFSDGLEAPEVVKPAITADEKIVVAWTKYLDNGADYAVARFNTNGTPDSTFSLDGIQTTHIEIENFAYSVVIQSNNKIVLAGSSGIVRYNTDGSLDETFGGNGIVKTGPGMRLLATQHDDKILVVGGYDAGAAGNNFFISRYNSNGSPDSTFNGDGKQITHIGLRDVPFSVAAGDNRKIVVGGFVGNVQNDNGSGFSELYFLARYNIDGSVDSTFGEDGILTTRNGVVSLSIQPDGKIIAGFDGKVRNGNDSIIIRYHIDGSPDSTFSNDGKIISAGARSIALQHDGKLVINGNKRYTVDGSPDDTFGENGEVTFGLAKVNTFYKSSAIQNDGKIVVAGYTFKQPGSGDFILTRYNTNGSLDSTFSEHGNQRTDFDSSNDVAQALALQSDGKIVVVGSISKNNNNDFAIARYNSDGSPDSTFDGDGKLTTNLVAIYEGDTVPTAASANSVVIQNDGKIVVAGTSYLSVYETYYMALVRYNADGTPDSTFNDDGKQIIDMGANRFVAMAIQGDGKIVITGGVGAFVIARFNTDGSLDNSFSDDGMQSTDFNPGDIEHDVYEIHSIAIQPDGKIIVAGTIGEESFEGFTEEPHGAIARYHNNGELDSSFSKDGKLIMDFGGGITILKSVAIQEDRKIVVAGTDVDRNTNFNSFGLARFDSSGNPDHPFGKDGVEIIKPGNIFSALENMIITNNKLYATGNSRYLGIRGIVAKYILDADGNKAPIVSLTTPNATYLAGGNVYLFATASDTDGTISKVEFYNDSTLLYTATDTPYTFKWQKVKIGAYTLTAKATDNSGLVTISAPVYISVVRNKPPIVSIISPLNNQTFLKGATIHLEAAANDADGRITKVEFYNGKTLLITEYQVPYRFDWKIANAGIYTITAKATDNWGEVTTSAVINVSVVPNQPPAVSIIKPLNGQIFSAPATINFEAAAQDTDGRIVQVDFYNVLTLLAREYKFPYTYQWQDVPAGTYTFTAVATDNWGATTISAPVTITVTPNTSLVRSRPSILNGKTGLNGTLRLQVAPNPATNILNIYTTGLQKNKQTLMSVISSSGVIMKTIKRLNNLTPTIQLDVTSLASGVYTIKLVSGDKVWYKKFVKL